MLEWPHMDYSTYEYVTEPTEKDVWSRAASAALHDITGDHAVLGPRIKALKQRIDACGESNGDGEGTPSKSWSKEYRSIVEEFISIQASASNEQSLDMAQAGIDALHDLLLFQLDDQTHVPAKDVFMLTGSFPKLPTKTLVGSKAPDIDFQFGITNPVNTQDTLFGMDAIAQIDAWYSYGCMETSASVLAKSTIQQERSLPSILANKRFVLLGCTAELGPAKSLLLIPGITVLGIARGGKKLDELIDYTRFNAPDDSTFLYNPKGADLLKQGPSIAQWIIDQTEPGQEIIMLPLAHLEGEADVRVSVAMDLIIQRVFRQREKAILCQYMSPTSIMIVPPIAATIASRKLEARPSWEKWTNQLTLGNWLKPVAPECNNDYAVINGILSSQGSHYTLARTLQMWRCMISYYREDHPVVAPFAPLTRTAGNMKISKVLEGMHHFEPMLAFDVGPASSLMTGVMLSQIQFMNRPLPDMEENPFTMFWEGAVPGGVWYCPYSLESIATLNWAMGKSGYYPAGYIPVGAIAKTKEERDQEPVRDPEEVFNEMESSYGQPMPDCVKERLDFM